MLTPGLACATTMCANMDVMADMVGETPCHEAVADRQDIDGIMIAIDCADVDLALADNPPQLSPPAIDTSSIDLYWNEYLIASNVIADHGLAIRGPPDIRQFEPSYPPVYQTTQRIRL